MNQTTEINGTFYAMRLLSHRLDISQIEVREGNEYPASEFTAEEQSLGLEILQSIKSEKESLRDFEAEEIGAHLTMLANLIEEVTDKELIEAGYNLEPTGEGLESFEPETVDEQIAELKRRMIVEALEGTGDTLTAAAKILGIDDRTLRRRLRGYQIKQRDTEINNT
jgi:DNA-binding NtrC family response regulator